MLLPFDKIAILLFDIEIKVPFERVVAGIVKVRVYKDYTVYGKEILLKVLKFEENICAVPPSKHTMKFPSKSEAITEMPKF